MLGIGLIDMGHFASVIDDLTAARRFGTIWTIRV
jgi:hypothetical protein